MKKLHTRAFSLNHFYSSQMKKENIFSFKYLEEIIDLAIDRGYKFSTLSNYHRLNTPRDGTFLLRLDLDLKPPCLKPFLELANRKGIPLTIFARVTGPYNVFGYDCFPLLMLAEKRGHEIGLHTTPVEWAKINEVDIEHAFKSELQTLRQWFKVYGVAPHRDVNYIYNSLPWLKEHWQHLKSEYALEYHPYEECLETIPAYINEGLAPHLCWRSADPKSVISTGRSIHMLLHPHWWYERHPFEV